MYCKKCGKKLDYGDKFCSGCGVNITPDIISPDPIEKLEDRFVEKKMTSIHDFERDDNESIGKAVEANFVIEDFDWDLDGFPEERDTKNDDLDFDWNPVLEKKNKRKEEAKVEEKPVKEDLSIESFADIIDTPSKEEIAHTIIELGLGSTATFEKTDIEAEEEALEEQVLDGAFEDDEDSSSDVSLFDELKVEEPSEDELDDEVFKVEDLEAFEEKKNDGEGFDLKGLGMASFDKEELDRAAVEIEALKREALEKKNDDEKDDEKDLAVETVFTEDAVDDVAKTDDNDVESEIKTFDDEVDSEAIGVDKFYTFNQKNEEFQALLDQEYERLRKRIREESEAEELLNRKNERLEKARHSWAMGGLEIVDSSKDDKDDSNEYLNDAIKTLKEETVEIPKDDEFQRLIDFYADENIKASKAAEAESEIEGEDEAEEPLDQFVNVEVEAIANSSNEEDKEVEVDSGEDDDATDEATTKLEAEDVDVVQPVKSFIVDETQKEDKPVTAEFDNKEEVDEATSSDENSEFAEFGSGVTDKTIVLPPKEQREKIKDMKAVAVVDYGDIFDEDEEDVPLTRKERKALKKAEKEREREEKKRQREEAKAKKAGITTDEASDEAAQDIDLEADESLEQEEPEKLKEGSKAGLIFLDIIIVILTIVVCGAAIMAFAPDSFLGNKIGIGVEKAKEAVGIGYDSKHAETKEPTGSPLQKMIKNASKDNANIGRIEEAPALVFSPSGDYAIKEVMQSVPFVDSVWHTDDSGKAVNYGDSIVKTTVKYYSDLVDKMTKGSDDILNLLVKDTDFYKNLEKTKALGEDKFSVDELKIGEIRSLDNNYFVLVEVSEKADGKDSVTKQLVQMIAQDKELKINNIVDVK